MPSPTTELKKVILILCTVIPSFFLVHGLLPETFAGESNNSNWGVGESMPTPRTELMAEVVDGKIYLIGGVDYSDDVLQIDKVEIYDTNKNSWNTNARPIPQAIDHGAAVAYNGKIYLPGGFSENKVPTDNLWIYDIAANEWKEGQSLPSPRGASTAEFINGTLYVVGGVNSSQVPINTMDAYDPKTDTWTTKKSMSTARHHLESAVVNGKLYVIGGRILGDGVPSEDIPESLTNYNRNEMYDPQTDTWTVQKPMQEKRSGFAVTSAGGKIYVFGGEGVKDFLDSVERYDPLTNTWQYESPMSIKRIGLEAVTVDNKIYVLGGQISSPKSGLVALDHNEIFYLKSQYNDDQAKQ